MNTQRVDKRRDTEGRHNDVQQDVALWQCEEVLEKSKGG